MKKRKVKQATSWRPKLNTNANAQCLQATPESNWKRRLECFAFTMQWTRNYENRQRALFPVEPYYLQV
jgi:hypothetical protein